MARQRVVKKVYLVASQVSIPGRTNQAGIMVYGKGQFLTDALMDARAQIRSKFAEQAHTLIGAFVKDVNRNIWVKVRQDLFDFAVSVSQQALPETDELDGQAEIL